MLSCKVLIDISKLPLADVSGIVHVGAHHAEELNTYLRIGIDRVVWVEANADNMPIIFQKITNFPYMTAANFAAGSKSDIKVNLNLANNGESSSILELGTHALHYPHIRYKDQKSVTQLRLDDYFVRSGLQPSQFNFLNLDIQGYELECLRGASTVLKAIKYLYTEVNTESVYNECALINEVDAYLAQFGFERVITKLLDQGWGDAFYTKLDS